MDEWNRAVTLAGMRPRGLSSMPCALAHSRTSLALGPGAEGLRRLGPGRPEAPVTPWAALA